MIRDDLASFLLAVDSELARHAEPGEALDLYLLGRSALILGYGVRLMTKDVDVVDDASARLLVLAVEIFGKGGSGSATQTFYLETVSSGLPPLPGGYQRRCVELPGPWAVLRPKLPEANDLVASKLRRFHRGDREDVRILCDAGDVDAETLRERFDSAHAFSDRDDPSVVAASENLRAVVEYLSGRRKDL